MKKAHDEVLPLSAVRSVLAIIDLIDCGKTGDAKLRSEGKADQVVGKTQDAIGGIKDAAKEALED